MDESLKALHAKDDMAWEYASSAPLAPLQAFKEQPIATVSSQPCLVPYTVDRAAERIKNGRQSCATSVISWSAKL
nr:hypothetical protein CFP56_04647 [Quercus suber]